MKVTVDLDICDGHGQCAFAAPDVFQLDDAGELRYEPSPDDSGRAAVETASRLCPVQAITVGT
jgi:ferredoxin